MKQLRTRKNYIMRNFIIIMLEIDKDGAYSTNGRNEKSIQNFSQNLSSLQDLDLNGRIILKYM